MSCSHDQCNRTTWLKGSTAGRPVGGAVVRLFSCCRWLLSRTVSRLDTTLHLQPPEKFGKPVFIRRAAPEIDFFFFEQRKRCSFFFVHNDENLTNNEISPSEHILWPVMPPPTSSFIIDAFTIITIAILSSFLNKSQSLSAISTLYYTHEQWEKWPN